MFQDNKTHQIFRKTNISYPLITCANQGLRNVRFSKNLTCFVFLKHPFLEPLFYLITYELTILHVTCSMFRYHSHTITVRRVCRTHLILFILWMYRYARPFLLKPITNYSHVCEIVFRQKELKRPVVKMDLKPEKSLLI